MTNTFLSKIILSILFLTNSGSSKESIEQHQISSREYIDQSQSKDKQEAQRQIKKFLSDARVSNFEEFESFRSSLNALCKKLENEFKSLSSDDWEEIAKTSNFIEYSAKIFDKVRDEVFAREGMIIQGKYPGVYQIYLKTEKIWKFGFSELGRYRLVKYKINDTESGLSFESLPNVELVFLDENGFQVYSKKLGNISAHDKITGEFEIPENEYHKIFSVHFRCS